MHNGIVEEEQEGRHQQQQHHDDDDETGDAEHGQLRGAGSR